MIILFVKRTLPSAEKKEILLNWLHCKNEREIEPVSKYQKLVEYENIKKHKLFGESFCTISVQKHILI